MPQYDFRNGPQAGVVTPEKFMADKLSALNQRVPYVTQLAPQEEAAFQQWVQQNKIPYDLNAPLASQDYDMRGFYKGLMSGDPRATTGINPSDNRLHFTDTWKTPLHPLFSNESIYATPDAPRWSGNDKSGWVLKTHDGKVIHEEKPL
jgi:hypothetical protein